jgi:hypothetical protein
MKSRRRIAFSKALDCADYRSQRILQQGFAVMKWVLGVRSQGTNSEPLMSPLGQKQTSEDRKADIAEVIAMSALCQKQTFISPYPIASSAIASSDDGRVILSILAVCMLMTSLEAKHRSCLPVLRLDAMPYWVRDGAFAIASALIE